MWYSGAGIYHSFFTQSSGSGYLGCFYLWILWIMLWWTWSVWVSLHDLGLSSFGWCCIFQLSSGAQSCPVLSDPKNCSTTGFPVHHQLPEPTQTHVHWVSDAIQPSHPLSFPSPLALNLCQHQGLFKWVSSSHKVAKVLEFQLQHQSFHWTPRTDLLQNGLVRSPCSPRDSQESSLTPQFKSINSSLLSFLYSPTLTSIHDHWKKPQPWLDRPLLAK